MKGVEIAMFLTKEERDFIKKNSHSPIINWDFLTKFYDLDMDFIRENKDYIRFFSFYSEFDKMTISSPLVIRLGETVCSYPEKQKEIEELFLDLHKEFWSPSIKGLLYNGEIANSPVDVLKQIVPHPSEDILLWFRLNY